MDWRPQINERGVIASYRNPDTGETISVQEYSRRMSMHSAPMYPSGSLGAYPSPYPAQPAVYPAAPSSVQPMYPQSYQQPYQQPYQQAYPVAPAAAPNMLVQPGAQMLDANGAPPNSSLMAPPPQQIQGAQAGQPVHAGGRQGKTLRSESNRAPEVHTGVSRGKGKGFLDATSIAILLPTLVLLALVIAAAHKKRLFPWQTIRTFNPPSGLMTPRDYERSFVCPPNGRRHGRIGKKNPNATWSDADGVVLPFGFLARTHLPVTIPMGRLPNKNMFIVAPSGSGKTTLMRAVIKALLAKPCVIIALEAKANDPNLDEKREGFKYTVLPEAQQAGFRTLYFNPLDSQSICWNPLDLDPSTFASSIVQDINSLPPEEQHWAERDFGYIEGLVQLLKWGAVQVNSEDENGQPAELEPLVCNPYGLMKLVNNRRNIVESMRRLKSDPKVNSADLGELTQRLSSIIRTDSDWDKNIQGVRGRLRMFKNQGILKVTEASNVDLKGCMHEPTVLIFGAPASLGPDAESLAACFVYQLQQALHTRYGTNNVLPLFAFFDEYQTLNIDLAGRLSAIVRGANGGLTVILQNISQITSGASEKGVSSELKTIFSNSAIRVCLHNADETTAKFFSEEIGKHAVVVPGVADHFQANGFGIFPTSWNRIHSQQVVARVDSDSIKRMEKHHALVYLSPAGDPEFGETKPFMVDLRGIEDIARLHLLHNVTARRQQPTPPPEGGVPGFGAPGGGQPGFARPNVAQIFEAVDRMASMGTSGQGGDDAGSQFENAQDPAYGQGAFPAPGAVGTPAPVPVSMGAAGGSTTSSQARMCQHCNKVAGKGKFCIECGQFIGLPQAGPEVEMVTSAQLVGGFPSVAEANVDSFGNPVYSAAGASTAQAGLSALPSQGAGPRYGGLRPQSRDAMPGKRGLFENAASIADAAQQVHSNAQEPNFNQTRRPVTSLTPDVSHMGIDKKNSGAEF